MTRRDALLALALSSGIVLLLAWPLPRFANTHLYMPLVDPDVQCGLWWPDAFVDSVLSFSDPFFRPELNYPVGQDVRLLIWNFFLQILFFPVYALTDPVLSLNLVALLIGVLNGLACGWAGWMATRSREGAVAALLVGAATLYGTWESFNGRPEQGFFAPLAIYAGAWFGVLRGERKMALVAGVALALAGATYWFYAIFGVLGTAPLGAWMLWRKEWKPLVVAGATSVVVVLPFLIPIALGLAAAESDYTVMRDAMDTTAQQARASLAFPEELLGAVFQSKGALSARMPLVVLPLAAIGLAFRETRVAAIGALAFTLLALGPHLTDHMGVPFRDQHIPLPHALVNHLPGFSRFWWPYRWIAPALIAASIVAAQLSARAPKWGVWVLASVLVLDAKAILKRGDGTLHSAALPQSILQLAESDTPLPVIAYPPRVVDNALVGLQPFHQQPIDGGLAWSEMAELRGDWEVRARSGLLGGLTAIIERRDPGPLDWGEWGAVVAFLPRQEDRRHLGRLEAYLGPPTEEYGPYIVWVR